MPIIARSFETLTTNNKENIKHRLLEDDIVSEIARRRILTVSVASAFASVVAMTGKVKANTDQTNREKVESFFVALETGRFEILREIFAEDAQQINPYSWGQFPKSFNGREGIYQQYSSLPQTFSKMSFPRTIYTTENPNILFVQFKGDIEIKAGGRYQNDYIGIFKFENGLIKEYYEYFNPILVSKAFNVPI